MYSGRAVSSTLSVTSCFCFGGNETSIKYCASARSDFLAERPIAIDQKAKPLLGPQACAIIAELLPDLSKVEPWTKEKIENAVRAFVERKDLKLGAVAQPLRAALTGRPTSPGIFDVLHVLGKPESLARLGDQASCAA